MLKYIDDKNGRIQILTFEHAKKKFMIVNVYNNNIEKQQLETLKKLDTLLGTFVDINDYSIVMGGTGTSFWIRSWTHMVGILDLN